MARATELAPMMSQVLGALWRILSRPASGAEVRLCSTTVEMITANTSGTSLSASGMPAWCRLMAKEALTAAATMPRGAIQPSRARARQERSDPQVETRMQSGRATNCTTHNSASTMGPSCQSWARSRRAASRMNREEMRMTARSSLKASTSSKSSPS